MSMEQAILTLQQKLAANELEDNFREALADIAAGWHVIVVDDYDRENEGDLILAGAKVTQQSIAFMMRWGRGIMCLPTDGAILDRLKIPPMVENSTDPYNTAFTVSIDAAEGITTGVCAYDRVKTISKMVDPESTPQDFARPGHLFPLRAQDNLLLDRRGHTEASVTLMKVLSLEPVAVISEIVNNDGSMARMPELTEMGKDKGIRIISIEEISRGLGIETKSD